MGIVRWFAALIVMPWWWIQDHTWRRAFRDDLSYVPPKVEVAVESVDYGVESWANVPAVADDPTLMEVTLVLLENPRRLAPLPVLDDERTITGEWAEVPVTPRQELVSDELGSWDPDTADWTLPAVIFENVSDDRFGSWASLVSYDNIIAGLQRPEHRESFTAFAERVLLTGV